MHKKSYSKQHENHPGELSRDDCWMTGMVVSLEYVHVRVHGAESLR